MKLVNRRFFKRQNFELLKSSILICSKTLFEYAEYEISYEHISNKKKIQSSINNNLFFISCSFLVIGMLFLLGSLAEISPLLIIIGSLLLGITFLNRKKTITIACFDGNTIELYFGKENKEQIVQFADQIINSANAFLLNKYSKIDRDLPIENQLSGLDFLKNREIITEEEFDSLKDQLLGRNPKSKIGFAS